MTAIGEKFPKTSNLWNRARPLALVAAFALTANSGCGAEGDLAEDDLSSTGSALSTTPKWTGTPDNLYALYGNSVAKMDLNCDGKDDLVVGAPDDAVTGVGKKAGKVFVYLANSLGNIGTTPMVALGSASDEDFGYAVAGADVNGDGCTDLVVGAPGFDMLFPTGGSAYVYLSAPGRTALPTPTILTVFASSFFGSTVASAGDVYAGPLATKRYAGVLVGDFSYGGHEGSAHLFRGSATGVSTTPAWTITGTTINDEFGYALAGGDINGDGYSDVIVGADGYPGGNPPAANGQVLVYKGSSTGLSTTPAWTATGALLNSAFGRSLATGDVNKDGKADLVVGAPSRNGGAVFVYQGGGSPTSLTLTLKSTIKPGPTGDHYLGASVATGDINGDTYADVVIGDYGTTGGAYAYLGGAYGLNTSTGTLKPVYWTRAGDVSTDYFGYSVATADFNKDGKADVIVGAPRNNDFTGKTYVFYGP
jgi:hypothetical protein